MLHSVYHHIHSSMILTWLKICMRDCSMIIIFINMNRNKWSVTFRFRRNIFFAVILSKVIASAQEDYPKIFCCPWEGPRCVKSHLFRSVFRVGLVGKYFSGRTHKTQFQTHSCNGGCQSKNTFFLKKTFFVIEQSDQLDWLKKQVFFKKSVLKIKSAKLSHFLCFLKKTISIKKTFSFFPS